MYEQYFKSPFCIVEVKLKKHCYNNREDLWEVRFRGKIIQTPMDRIQFTLSQAADITSLWTIVLDINEIESFTIKCDNVINPFEYNR